MSRRRPPSEEERALWMGFARSIEPLDRARKAAERQPLPRATTSPQLPRPLRRRAQRLRRKNRRQKKRRRSRRLGDGSSTVLPAAASRSTPASICTASRNERRTRRCCLLHRAQADGVGIALVVTGKGTGKVSGPHEPGVLKRQVPMWLSLPEFRSVVVGFEDAHTGHGGEGGPIFDCVACDEELAINADHRIANVCARNGQLRLQEWRS